jgi:hypothetical protein
MWSVCGSVIITLMMLFFSSLMKWNVFLLNFWSNRKNTIESYIRAYMIRPLYLYLKYIILRPEKWKMVRNRILAINYICGKYIRKKNAEKQRALKTGKYLIFDVEYKKNDLKNSKA